MTPQTFSGSWRCTHWYPTKDDSGEESSVHEMQGHQVGNDLILQSVPNQEESYLLVRLSIDDELATGTWHETTLASGNFEGAIYSGAGQLVIDPDKKHMEGQWAGHGFDHKANKVRIYTGRWELARIGD